MRMIRHILVVCVGNICRSPMAEALLRDALRGQEEVTVESAGLGAVVDYPAAEHAEVLMAERGLDISGHRARQLTPDLINASDLILVMEAGHKRAIDAEDPAARGKVHRLCEWQDKDVPDPFRQSREAFEEVLLLIEQGVQDWADRIKA
jgi:protein-tyrosine phosphatase